MLISCADDFKHVQSFKCSKCQPPETCVEKDWDISFEKPSLTQLCTWKNITQCFCLFDSMLQKPYTPAIHYWRRASLYDRSRHPKMLLSAEKYFQNTVHWINGPPTTKAERGLSITDQSLETSFHPLMCFISSFSIMVDQH